MIIQEPIITSSIDGDNIKANNTRAYIGYQSTSSNATASNELVFGINTVGYGNNTATIGNTNTIRTKLHGAIYEHENLTGSSANTYNLQKFYVYTLSGSFTASLPASPNIGDSIKISNQSTSGSTTPSDKITDIATTIQLNRNGSNIMGTSQDMKLDNGIAAFELIYTNPDRGWVVIGSN